MPTDAGVLAMQTLLHRSVVVSTNGIIANIPQTTPLIQAVAALPFSPGCAWYIPQCAYQ